MRVVPIRGFSGEISAGRLLLLILAPGRSRSRRGGREAALSDVGRQRLPDELFVLALSASGGGVGGNRFLVIGGSEC